jgi:hypothetical protein
MANVNWMLGGKEEMMIVHFLDFMRFLYGPSQVPTGIFPGFTLLVFTPFLGSPPQNVNSAFYCIHFIITFITLFLQDISHTFS